MAVEKRRAYFETSALDAVLKQGIPVSDIRLQLEARGLSACVGMLTLNECAQPILSDKGDVAGALFGIIRDLQPRFPARPVEMYEQEARLLRDGTPVNPFPTKAQEEYERSEVGKLADGYISREFLDLVRDRRKVKFEEWPTSMGKYVAMFKQLRRDSAGEVPKFGSFEQLEALFRGDLPRIISTLPDLRALRLSSDEADLVAANVDRCPAIRSTVYFWLNAMFVCLAHGCAPSVDKVDDWRHVVEASYCDTLITNDAQLLRSMPRLHPTLAPLHVGALTTSITAELL